MDYGVHSWDIREGTGRAHGLHGDAADLLVPFMFVHLEGHRDPATRYEPFEHRHPGHHRTERRRLPGVGVGPDGMTYEPGDIDGLPAVLEFDPGSFVLTAFGRCTPARSVATGVRPTVPQPVLPDLRMADDRHRPGRDRSRARHGSATTYLRTPSEAAVLRARAAPRRAALRRRRADRPLLPGACSSSR